MLSIVICSRSCILSPSLIENIQKTAGVELEIITVDNSNDQYNIFSAYNFGASRAKYDLLCFMHEDILFHSLNWGQRATELLSNPQVGVIGVAGSRLISAIPSPWWISNFEFYKPAICYNIIQHTESGNITHKMEGFNEVKSEPSKVLVVDGVWMCCRKEVWQENKFDQFKFNGFHFYDMDFSMQIWEKGYTNLICQNILIEHFSSGNINQSWINDAFVFHNKWKKILPASVCSISKIEWQYINNLAIRNLLNTYIVSKVTDYNKWIVYWLKGWVHKPFSKIYYSLAYQYLKLHFR